MVCKAVPSVHNAKQGKKSKLPEKWAWVETSVWTDRMLAALENGVKGGKWFSLIDKISSVRTLTAAWKQVAANRGSAGVDRISIERPRWAMPASREKALLFWDTVLKPASVTFARRAWQACGNVFGKRPNVLVARAWMESYYEDG